jgi:CheY-like chemotaxis protein
MDEQDTGLFGLQGRRLLVVEDNAQCAAALARWLEICGARVAIANSVDAACARLRAERPDLLLVDLHLPDGTGWDVVDAAREVPAVAITGGAGELGRNAASHGVRHVIAKPIAPAALADALSQSLTGA